MKRAGTILFGILALIIAAHAAPATVTGTWTMSVEGGPHGAATMGLVLKQNGTKVTGTFASGHGPDQAVSGELVDGVLKLDTGGEGEGDHRIIFSAKLKDDGTLAGSLSSPVGDMRWTARRAKDAK